MIRSHVRSNYDRDRLFPGKIPIRQKKRWAKLIGARERLSSPLVSLTYSSLMDQLPPADTPAGIHCANPSCRTRAGERSRGHQSCRAQLCGSCCQNEAKAAAEKGEQRPVCKVHARRTHTGHRPAGQNTQQQKEALSGSHAASSILVLSDRDVVQSSMTSLSSSTSTLTGLQIPVSDSVGGVASNNISSPSHTKESDLNELLDKRSRLEQSLKRSLTIVVWYKNGYEPLRIAHEVQTFPLFHLQDFPELVSELHLTASSYIDTYNADTGQWEQHKISTVRSIRHNDQEQENQEQYQFKNDRNDQRRLLYRIRPSLLESLTDCPELDKELQYQPLPLQNIPQTTNLNGIQQNLVQSQSNGTISLKRADPFTTPAQGKHARILANNTPIRAPSSTTVPTWETQTPSPSLSNVTATANANNTSPSTWGFAAPSTPVPPPISAQPSPSSTRRWPTDYTVHEITSGFSAMSKLMTDDPSLRQKAAFERVFAPCRYVKSTVGRAKLYWKRANEQIKTHFLSLADGDERGKWTHFVHLMDGRLVIELSDGNVSQTVPPAPERTTSADGPQDLADEVDAKADSADEEDTQTAQTPATTSTPVVVFSNSNIVRQPPQHQHSTQPRVNVHPNPIPSSSPALSSPNAQPHASVTGHPTMSMISRSNTMNTLMPSPHVHPLGQNHGHSPHPTHPVHPSHQQHPSLPAQSSHPPHLAGSRPSHATSHVSQNHSGHSHHPNHSAHAAHNQHPSHQPHPSPLTHHASVPSMAMGPNFVNDRNLGNNHRSTSSLSGAITIPNS